MKLIWVGGWFGLSISVRIGSDKQRELKDWTMYLGWIIISDEELAYAVGSY